MNNKKMTKEIKLTKGITASYSKELEDFTINYIEKNKGVKTDLLNTFKELMNLVENPQQTHSLSVLKLITVLELKGFQLNFYVMHFELKDMKCTYTNTYKGSVDMKNIDVKFIKYLEYFKDNFKFDFDKVQKNYIKSINNQLEEVKKRRLN